MAKYKSQTIQRIIPQKLKLTQMPGFRLIEGTVWPLSGEDKFGWGIRDKDYEALYSNYGNNDFLFKPWSTVDPALRLEGISKAFLNHYIHFPQFEFFKNSVTKIKLLVSKNKFNQIVTNFTGDDGYLYDLKGDPIYRSFHIELCQKYYFIGSISSHLLSKYKAKETSLGSTEIKKNTIKIGNLFSEEVPYYNREICGGRQLVFNFYPKNYQQFMQLYELDKEDCLYDAEEEILDILGIKKKFSD